MDGVSLDAIVDEARALARETGGERAARAVTPGASLEREVGLGSLERVELIARLERRFRVRLPEDLLEAETCADIERRARGATPDVRDAPFERAAPARGTETTGDPDLAASLPIPETLDRALAARAEATPRRVTIHLTEDDGAERDITYATLFDAAARIASGLGALGISRGDRVALMLPTGFDFLRTFQGSLLGGAIAVPIYPPLRMDRLAEYAERQSAILRSAGVRVLVTVPRGKPIAQALKAMVPTLLDVVTADDVVARADPRLRPSPQAKPGDPAFIQYTSGSTGTPKGVLLTHANLMANIRAISRGTGESPEIGVSWLPLYHDMGLIGAWLFTMTCGHPLALRSPLSFLSRPERWLWDIHRRRATLSAAPNFAYELCVRRIRDDDVEGLDLSSWKCALNGAEPVRPETLERFISRFSRYGFRREAMMPVFGLAENSVALTFPPVLRGPLVDRVSRAAFERGDAEKAAADDATASVFVSAGRALPEHEIRIVDDDGHPLGERRVGRLIFQGPSMTSGYFENSDATQTLRPPGAANAGFFDTGDLAYVADGELFVAGRRKDLIIRAGRNLVAAEIEEAAAGVAGVRTGCVAAFGVADAASGTEQLVVVAEARARGGGAREAIESAVVERVASLIGTPPDVVRVVPPGSVPKTSSGKIRRSDTRALYLNGGLGRSAEDSPIARARLAARALSGWLSGHAARAGLALRGFRAYGALALAAPILRLMLVGASRERSRAIERGAARLAVRILGLRISVDRSDGVAPDAPLRAPALVVSNHASYLDIVVLLAELRGSYAFVSKREALGYPLVGAFLRRSGHVAVERFDARQSAQDEGLVRRALESGDTVVVFPEGTFTRADGLRPFRLGAFKSAAEAGVPVIPVALRGTRRILRDGQVVPRAGAVSLWIGAPIAPEGGSFHDLVRLRDRVREEIGRNCGEPILDLVAAGPERTE